MTNSIRWAACAAILAVVYPLVHARLVDAQPAAAPAAAPAAEVKPAEAVPADPAAPVADAAAPGTEAAAVDEEAQRKAEAERKQAERLQKIQQLQFDRRPSTILRAWSTPADAAAANAANPAASGVPAAVVPVPVPVAPTIIIEGPDAPLEVGTVVAPAGPPDPFDAELAAFQRDVTLGAWDKVKTFLAGLAEEEGKAAYKQMLAGLQSAQGTLPPDLSPQMAQLLAQLQAANGQMAQMMEKNAFSFDDVLALAAAAPKGLENEHLQNLGGIVRQALDGGNLIEGLLVRLRAESARDGGALNRRQSARLLIDSGFAIEAGEFLPQLPQAEADKDHEALNLLARHFLAQNEKEPKDAHLEQAWQATQAVLAAGEIKPAEKDEALRRAVDLAPKIREAIGQTWLEESFTARPERGMEIIAAIGTAAAQAQQMAPVDPDTRLKGLKLQTTAVEALLKASPELAGKWRDTLTLLARNWLTEAVFSYANDSSTSLHAGLRRDPFGNYFYYDEYMYSGMMQQQMQVQPVKTGELLKIKPSQAWLDMVVDSLSAKFLSVYAQLYLKVAEEDEAFPYIERLAAVHPDRARELVDEFLRVWTQNHDPNANQNRTNFYMFSYGYERRAEGIPLTRSKQERNLAELAALVPRLKALPVNGLDEDLLAAAFTTCHSNAEVYRLDAIEKVFGPIADLKPATTAALVQQMRSNLSGLWRAPAVQEENKTKRKQQDIQAEVLRGYGVAREVVAGAMQKHPDDWSLQLAEACLEFDENNYRREIAPEPDFSERRGDAFEKFARAAALYSTAVADLPIEKQETRVFDHWFYASLGACDLEGINEKSSFDLRQPEKIREAIAALPAEAAERHLGIFANSLFTRMSAANAAIKFRYVRAGFEIVGDHPQAAEARKLHDYYQDLVSEIKLDAVIDGSDVVGQAPFGVFINLRHTREIERESGGFARYLQNQNNMYFSYNYGRPTEDYRDKFQKIVEESLAESFEVLSVTFQDENVNSRAIDGDYGWRYTPYAYLLLKARGPQVDRLPSVRLDLDFLDTSGYVILPVETPAIPVDASAERPETRPARKIQVTQILDERQADEGRLLLEVKATTLGLAPPLDEIVKLEPGEFVIDRIDDPGVSVSRFDPESAQNTIISERLWTIGLSAKPNLPERPKTFRFASALADDTEMTYQRYVDADLAGATPVVSLEERYGTPRPVWPWIVGGAAAVLALVVAIVKLRHRRTVTTESEQFAMPTDVTAFTVLGLLRSIERHNHLGESDRRDLTESIARIERAYFAETAAPGPDLTATARDWLEKVGANGMH
jgi:hypothetical protein